MSTTPTQESDCDIISTRTINAPRERIFAAFRDPKQLAQWWGPKDFRNTFHEFDFRPGGHWRFIMHGPDGTDYKNESVFLSITEPERIVIDHICPPYFRMTITLEDQNGKTGITWHMRFQSAEVCASVRPICVEANQQNFDRLEAVLNVKS